MTDGGCCSPVRERIDDGGVEPRWRRPTGKEMGTLLCSLSAAATRSTKEWVWGWKEMPPPGARRSSQGQRSNDEGWRTGSHWSSVTMLRNGIEAEMLVVLDSPKWGIHIVHEHPNPRQ